MHYVSESSPSALNFAWPGDGMVKRVEKTRSGDADSDPAPSRGRNRQAAAAAATWTCFEDDSSSGDAAAGVPGRPKAAAAAASGPVRPRARAPAAPAAAVAAGRPPPARAPAPAPAPAPGVMAWFVSGDSSSEGESEEDEVSESLETECNDHPETECNEDQETECIELLSDDEDEDIEAIEILSSDLEDDVKYDGVTFFEPAGASGPQQPVQPPLYQANHVAPLGSLRAPAAAAAARSQAGAAASAALAAKLRPAAAAAAAGSSGAAAAAAAAGSSGLAAAAAAAAAVPLPDDGPPRKKQRRCSVLDLCGSQVVSYQEELANQRDVYNMYVDGSYRPHWPSTLQMSAGGFARCPPHCTLRTASWFNFSLLLVGGTRGSMPAELGAIYIGCAKLQQAIAAGSIDPASSEVHMHTDCQGAANMLKRKGARVPHGLGPLITGIKVRLKQLKQHMPVRLRWVKGHQKGAPTQHGSGNDEAHKRAQPSSLQGAEQMPTDPQGDVVPDEECLKAVWQLFVSVRDCGKQTGKARNRRLQQSRGLAVRLGNRLKRSGRREQQLPQLPKMPPLPKRVTAAARASERQQARQQRALGAGAAGAMLGAAGAAAAAGLPPAAAAAAASSALLRQQMLMHTATAAGAAPFVFFGMQFTPAPPPAAAGVPPRSQPIMSDAPASGAGAGAAPGLHQEAQPPGPVLLGAPGPTQARTAPYHVPPWQQRMLRSAAAAGTSTVPCGAAAAAAAGPSSLPGAAAAAAPSTLTGSTAAARPSTLPGAAAAAAAAAFSTLPNEPQHQQLDLCELLPPASPDSSPAASSEHAAPAPSKPAAVGVSAERVVICIDC